MANLIINRTREVEIGAETFINGKWKLEVVCPNGEIKKPLGDHWRPNLLIRRGALLQLAALIDQHETIASLMNTAQYGNRVDSPNDRDYNGGVVNSTWSTITTDAQLGMFGYSSYSSVGSAGNTVTTNLSTGSIIFQKTYDFLATPNQQTVKEIVITDWTGDNTRGTGRADSDILSRFVLPQPVVLDQYQFLRLTYALQVTIPAIVTPISIDVQSGDFNGLGQLKCVGAFSNIFGWMNSTGQPQSACTRSPCSSSSCYGKPLPWCMVGRDRTIGVLLAGGDLSGTAQPAFPAINQNIDTTLRAQPGSQYVYSDGPGGSTYNIGYSNGNLSYSRGATLLFPATNPNLTEQYIGGILITPTRSGGCGDFRSDSLGYAAWYWRFTDALGNPRGQLKDINFALAINVQHTASIT